MALVKGIALFVHSELKLNSCFSGNGKLISVESVDRDESDSEEADDEDAEGSHFYYINKLHCYGNCYS